MKDNKVLKAYKAAFPYSIPVMVGYLFIGISFGIMMADKGYGVGWAGLMSLFIYTGTGQFVAVSFFVPGYNLLEAFLLELMVNARYMLYGISLFHKFEGTGWRKPYLIHAITDETYSVLVTQKAPEGIDEKWFIFAVSSLDQSYWIIGSIIGNLVGNAIPFSTEGIDFAMIALFIVIMVDMLTNKTYRFSAYIGFACAIVCLLAFGKDKFLIPTMVLIVMSMLVFRKRLEPGVLEQMEKEESDNADISA